MRLTSLLPLLILLAPAPAMAGTYSFETTGFSGAFCGFALELNTVVTVLDLSRLLTRERAVTVGSIVLVEHGSRLVGLAVQTVRDVRAAHGADETASGGPTEDEVVVPLDAAALCARYLLSSEEMGQ